MSDRLVLRDHSRQCEHGYVTGHWTPTPSDPVREFCNGGREVVFLSVSMLEVVMEPGYFDEMTLYVEVTDDE